VSIQITVLKVLASYPGGSLPVDHLKRAVAILISSGADWTERTKRLLAHAPGLDIFGQSLVIRDANSWQITGAGQAFLAAIEDLATGPAAEAPTSPPTEETLYSTSAPLQLAAVARRRVRRRRRMSVRSGRPAA
jgi:hypothetical protein